MTIQIQNRQRRVAGFDTAALRHRAQAIDGAAQTAAQMVSVTLVSDARIHGLNREYRGLDRPTDVLSFSQNEGEFAALNNALLGDVIISVERAERQRNKRTLLDEVTHLLIHGVLHLQGYDHQDDSDAKVMESEEKRIWRAVRANSEH